VEVSETSATRFIKALQAHFQPLRRFPLSGVARGQLAPKLRVTFHRPYAIYYTHLREAIVIVRVLHGARDIMAITARGGLDLQDE
jgi:toxin ParE1/3/4